MTRVWCLVAEGDYVRIRVSLCLLRSETEMKDVHHIGVRVYEGVYVYVGGGNIIVSSHLHSLVYVLEYLSLCF